MLEQGSLTLEPEDWPRGFRIVLVSSAGGDVCDTDTCQHHSQDRPVQLNITVGSNGTDFQTFKATIIVAVCYLIIGLVSICISVVIFKFKCDLEDVPEDLSLKSKASSKGCINPHFIEDEPISLAVVHIVNNMNNVATDGITKTKTKTVSSISTKLFDKTKSKSMYKKSRLYLGILWLMSIFYSLPVIQMVFRFSHQQRISGNQDICFYNDLCKKPFRKVDDFNHIFSNLGYCVFGLLFMYIVKLRKQKFDKFEREMREEKGVDCSMLGVPRQHGLYYAMGVALMMEGVMSACYHVCPTNVTFQFDTTFM